MRPTAAAEDVGVEADIEEDAVRVASSDRLLQTEETCSDSLYQDEGVANLS